jgi:hypothetical protein
VRQRYVRSEQLWAMNCPKLPTADLCLPQDGGHMAVPTVCMHAAVVGITAHHNPTVSVSGLGHAINDPAGLSDKTQRIPPPTYTFPS